MKIPGLVDLQVNGYLGVDFSNLELTEQDVIKACRELLKHGTTAFLPTVITSSAEIYQQNLPMIANVMDQAEFKGRLLGFHIEGPFISPNDGPRGAHNKDWVRKPDPAFLDQIIEWADGKVKLLTIAAEVEGAEALAQHAVNKGITVSLGHQMANENHINRLTAAGASALTHLGNGIPGMVDRHHNPIWAGLANDALTAMIITDSHHLPASLVKTILKVKGTSACIVVSDAAPLAGLQPGEYVTLGNEVVLEENGKLHNPAGGHLVGSSATILECMNWLAGLDFLSIDELLQVGFYNPLKLIGVESTDVADNGLMFDKDKCHFFLPKMAGGGITDCSCRENGRCTSPTNHM